MNQHDDDIERLKRLRDRQIQARDPHVKKREWHQRVSMQQRKKRQRFTFGALMREIDDIPNKWKGAVIGATIGTIVLAVLMAAVEADWAILVGIALIAILMLIGFVFGASFDWRDEVSDFFKR